MAKAKTKAKTKAKPMTSLGEYGLFCVKFYLCNKFIDAPNGSQEKDDYERAWLLVAHIANQNEQDNINDWRKMKVGK